MTVIDDDRTELNDALKDVDFTLLLISGSDSTDAQKVHDKAEAIQDPWCQTFWVRNLGKLTPTEQNEWFATGGCYAVICAKKVGGKWVRFVSQRGRLADFFTDGNQLSGKYIQDAFASCVSTQA